MGRASLGRVAKGVSQRLEPTPSPRTRMLPPMRIAHMCALPHAPSHISPPPLGPAVAAAAVPATATATVSAAAVSPPFTMPTAAIMLATAAAASATVYPPPERAGDNIIEGRGV